MIRCPKAVFEKYWRLPFAEVEAAAEAHRDGLSVCGPKRLRSGDWPLEPPQRPENYDRDAKGKAAHDRNVEEFNFDVNHAYFRNGDDYLSRGKTLLFMQGWIKGAASAQAS